VGGAKAVALLAVLFGARLTRAQDAGFVSVRGVAWDSLRSGPLGGAFIGIAGTTRSATTDARGRFRFDSVAPGTHTFTMQHDVLDSIGFTGRSVRVAVSATNSPPPSGYFTFRVREFCRSVQVCVCQGERLLHAQAFRALRPNDSARLSRRWLDAVQPDGEALRVIIR